jgi:hypothetical protein
MKAKHTALWLGVLALALLAPAATAQSTSVGNGTWEDPNNWNPVGVPGAGDDVIIAAGHTVTATGKKNVKSLTVNAGGTLTGPAGGDLRVNVTDNITNNGTIKGGDGGFGATPRNGGSVGLTAGGGVTNGGGIAGGTGAGGGGGNGGGVTITAGGAVNNAGGGTIKGGSGGVGLGGMVSQDGGSGGTVRITAGGAFTNGGAIQGGHGQNAGEGAGNGNGGSGGPVFINGAGGATNTGTIKTGDPGRGHGSGRDGEKKGGLLQGEPITRVSGPDAGVQGGWVTIQTELVSMSLVSLPAMAIQATNGPVTIVSPGTLDLTGNFPPGPRIVSSTGILILADTVVMDRGVTLADLCQPVPVVRRRAKLQSMTPARPGLPYVQVLAAPDDQGATYVCATAFRTGPGIVLEGFAVLPIPADPLFFLSLQAGPPLFQSYSGVLLGQAQPTMLIAPLPQLVGVELCTTAVLLDQNGWRNLAAPNRVVIQP